MRGKGPDDNNETGENEDGDLEYDLEYEENQLIKIEKRGITTHLMSL
jgi:hypothetical protein